MANRRTVSQVCLSRSSLRQNSTKDSIGEDPADPRIRQRMDSTELFNYDRIGVRAAGMKTLTRRNYPNYHVNGILPHCVFGRSRQ